MAPTRREILAGLSLANLALLASWHEALPFTAAQRYVSNTTLVDQWATCIVVLALAVPLAAAIHLVRQPWSSWYTRVMRGAAGLFLTAAALTAINGLRVSLDLVPVTTVVDPLNRGGPIVLLTGAAVAALGLYAAVRFRSNLAKLGTSAMVFLAPWALVTFGHVAWNTLKGEEGSPPATVAQPAGRQPPFDRRVILVVFDELDQRVAFDQRPPDLELPAFDRLRQESFSATSAQPPATNTLESMPSLIIGASVERAIPTGDAQLLLQVRGRTDTVPWSTQPGLVAHVAALDVRSALVGWYHPYCRILKPAPARCVSEPLIGHIARDSAYRLLDAVRENLRALSPLDRRREHAVRYRAMLKQAVEYAGDPTIGFALLHLPVPHPPPIYDRTRGRFTVLRFASSGYLDNLALADVTLAQIRSAIEAADLWQRTTVIVTSDHPWREAQRLDGRTDPRVPFIVKVAGDSHPLIYSRPTNTVITSQIVLAALRGEVHTSADVAGILDQQ